MRKKKGIRRFSLKKDFFESLKYIKESRRYIYFIITIFFIASVIGFIYSDLFVFVEVYLREILAQTEGMNAFELIAFILDNNVKSAFFGLFLGVFVGIVPIINALGNGAVLGYVAERVTAEAGFFEMWRILPHGIFELTAIFIALGIGVKFGLFMFSRTPMKTLKERFYSSLRVFFFVVLPLLVIAAIIEGLLIAFI